MTTTADIAFVNHTDIAPVRQTLLEIYADVRRDLLHLPYHSLNHYAERLDRDAAQPGWEAVVAYADGEPVGSIYCTVVRPDDPCWRKMEEPLPEGFEQVPTIAVQALWVRAAWRKTGTSARLHDTLLAGRTEQRATGLVNPEDGDGKVQALYESSGYKPFNRLRPAPEAPVYTAIMRSVRP